MVGNRVPGLERWAARCDVESCCFGEMVVIRSEMRRSETASDLMRGTEEVRQSSGGKVSARSIAGSSLT